MENLINQINSVPIETKELIEQRLAEFSSFKAKGNEEWFSELCFCILTANSKQKTGASIQQELGSQGFLTKSQEEISRVIIKNKHRFHNNKSKYIVQAREFKNIKDIVQEIIQKSDTLSAREWIVNNIKGLGYKESSHFLRNTGHEDLAILDRHILNLMNDSGIIQRPKILTKKSYLEIEKKFKEIASNANMSPSKLDLYMWYLKTKEVLK